MARAASGPGAGRVGDWRVEGDALVCEIVLRDFEAAFALVGHVAAAAQDHFRRPDMCISEFNHVRLTVANPHHAGITDAERRLVAKVDAVLRQGVDRPEP